MSNLLEWKEKLQILYARYSAFVDKGIRFILAVTGFLLINGNIGFMQKLTNPLISIGLAVICAFLPTIVTVFAAAGLMMLHMFSLSPGIAAIAAGCLLIMFIFYFRFTPKKAVILLLTPLAFALRVPVLIPVVYGLVGTPVYAVPVVCGTVVYFLIKYAKTFAATINSADKANMMTMVTKFTKQIFQSKEIWVVIAAMVLALLLVYALRKKSMDHAWKIAIASGAAAYVILVVTGSIIFDTDVKYVSLILGSILSVVIGLGLELMVFSVDYARSEYLQFEDDEYYYYVKAIPKVSVAMPEKKVKRINRRENTETIDVRRVNREAARDTKRQSQTGHTGRTQLTGDVDIDRIIEQELMKK